MAMKRISMRSMRQRRRSRGVAMLTAMALLSLVAIVLIALTALTRTQLLHTRHVTEEAQLRQMLLAGERAAATALNEISTDAVERTVPLPASLAEANGVLVLRFEPVEQGQRAVHVRALLGEREADQLLRYQQGEGEWQLETAVLNRTR